MERAQPPLPRHVLTQARRAPSSGAALGRVRDACDSADRVAEAIQAHPDRMAIAAPAVPPNEPRVVAACNGDISVRTVGRAPKHEPRLPARHVTGGINPDPIMKAA